MEPKVTLGPGQQGRAPVCDNPRPGLHPGLQVWPPGAKCCSLPISAPSAPPRPWPSGAQNVPRDSIPAPSGSPPGYLLLSSVQRAGWIHGYLLPRAFPSSSVGAISLSLKHTASHIIHTSPNFRIGLRFVLVFALSSLYAFVLAHPTQLCLHNCLHFKVQLTCLFLRDVSSYCYLPSILPQPPGERGSSQALS